MIRRRVALLGPHDGQPVAARHHEQALTDRRGVVLARAQLAELDLVAMALQLEHGAAERDAALVGIRKPLFLAIDQLHLERPPGLELLDVLQHDDARLALGRPAQCAGHATSRPLLRSRGTAS